MTGHRPRRWHSSLVALALAGACESATLPEEGAFIGRIDGQPWVGDATVTLVTGAPGGDILYVHGSSPRGADAWGIEESVSARVFFDGRGVYTLGPDDVSFFEITGGDVVSAEYRGRGNPAGLLEITRYDATAGLVEGELRFQAETTSPYASYGSTARFEGGRFRAALTVQPVNLRGGTP